MKRAVIPALAILIMLTSMASAQEVTIGNFPVGVGTRVSPSLFKPYDKQLRAIADTMKSDFHAIAVITGSADGITYKASHDAKNPGLALGRAHALRNYMISQYGVDSVHIVVQSEDAKEVGGQFRSVSIRLLRNWFGPSKSAEPAPEAIAQPVPEPERAEPAPREIETFVPVLIRQMGLQFGIGVTSSPFGGIPFGAAALTWRKTVFLEASLGYTFWDRDYTVGTTTLNTRRRISGARLIVFPIESLPVGVVGGWSRVEQISQSYYQYVRLSEGLELGLRATPLPFASVTAIYNPSMHRRAAENRADAKNGQFEISLMLHKTFGGER
ncbi:hypothetical protein C3F09_01915 [candidate division GN15 bacterium]|uniref:OmpA-like domain-containing protein n=1 Tax=candidate division GN15 bacterium TaxID=2072418 RepID=A0A855XAC0_9BACT|nr:MAG: hypothetical protein C3F09_01915 [candidate division GN15 bacterium]